MKSGASFRVTITPQVEAAIAAALERAFDLFHWTAKDVAMVAVDAIRAESCERRISPSAVERSKAVG